MIAISTSPRQAANAGHDDQFLELIPAIERYSRSAFRNLRPQTREEAICAVVADAFFAFRRLVELGKQDVAYATPLARFAVRRYWSGRCASMPRGDIMSQRARTTHGIVVERLDMFDEDSQHWARAAWLKTVRLPLRRIPRLRRSTWRPGSDRSPDGTAGLQKPWPLATRPAMRLDSSESPGHASASCAESCRQVGRRSRTKSVRRPCSRHSRI